MTIQKGGNCPKGGNHDLEKTDVPGTMRCKKCGHLFKTGGTTPKVVKSS
jgi:ribosomal protein L37AE/L43A